MRIAALFLALVIWLCGSGFVSADLSYAVEHTASEFSSRVFAVRPDGHKVALALDGDIWLLTPDVDATAWAGRMPLGTQLTRLTWGGQTATARPWARWIHRLPTWLPDGRLLYLRATLIQDPDAEGPADRELWIVGSGAPRKLADLAFARSVALLVPDPGGSHLLCVAGDILSMVDLRTGQVRRLRTPGLPGAPVDAVWSPDGRSVAVAIPKGNSLSLYRVELGTGALRQLTRFTTATGPITPPALAWPPGSDSVLVHVWDPAVPPGAAPPHGGIARVPAGGGDPMLFVPAQPGLAWPRWSPDGRLVAYLNRTDGYRYVLDLASGHTLRLGGWSRQEPEAIRFEWERDSRHVWYPCLTGLCRITLSS